MTGVPVLCMPMLQVKLLMEDGWNLLVSSARINQKTVAKSPICLLKTRPSSKEMITKFEQIVEKHNAFVDKSESGQKLTKLKISRFTQPSKTCTIVGECLLPTSLLFLIMIVLHSGFVHVVSEIPLNQLDEPTSILAAAIAKVNCGDTVQDCEKVADILACRPKVQVLIVSSKLLMNPTHVTSLRWDQI